MLLFKLVAVAASIAILLVIVDWREVIAILPSLRIGYLPLVLVIITADRFLMAAKWAMLVRGVGVRVPFADALRAYYVGGIMGSILPATVGLDLTRVWQLSSRGHNLVVVSASVLVERAVGFVALSFVSLVAVVWLAGSLGLDLLAVELINLSAIGVLVLFVAVSLSSLPKKLLATRPDFLSRHRVGRAAGKLYRAYLMFRDAKVSLVVFFLLTLVECLVPVVVAYLVGVALGIVLPIQYFAVIMPIYMFLARIPVPVNVLGVQEGMQVVLFSLVGVSPAQALSMGIVRRAVNVIAVTPGLLLFLMDQARKRPAGETMPESPVRQATERSHQNARS